MTVIEKVLLRKDIASVAVAVVVGMATFSLLGSLSGSMTGEVFGSIDITNGPTFAETYIAPVFAFALQVVLLELLLRAVIAGRKTLAEQKK